MNDLISRQDAIDAAECIVDHHSITPYETMRSAIDHLKRIIDGMPSAEPETFDWCHGCKEYDQEQHCCHRWTKQIRKTVEELEADYPQAMKDELEYWKKRAEEAEADYIKIADMRGEQ